MNNELEQQLIKKYPKILKNHGGDPMYTCMAFGIECDDGWYELLDKCMQKLQYFCDLCSKDGRDVQVVAAQIKEKYGTLRFYIDTYETSEVENNIIEDIVSETEMRSCNTCEVTGDKTAELCKRGGWYRTLCYEQARKSGYVACSESIEKYWQEKDKKQHDA